MCVYVWLIILYAICLIGNTIMNTHSNSVDDTVGSVCVHWWDKEEMNSENQDSGEWDNRITDKLCEQTVVWNTYPHRE